MKTNSLRGRKLSIYSLFGLVGLLASSCGSYQNSSYYDNDGVYGSSERPAYQKEHKYSEENVAQGTKYKEYFGANKDQYSDNGEVFTDVENYTSQANDSVARNSNEGYAGWGDNNQNITVNYYSSPWYGNYGWGWNYPYYSNFGWGWNSYYGSSWSIGFGWGWNYPYYGWGWNYPYYGGYYPYYGNYYPYGYHHHHYVYGTRGGYTYNGDRTVTAGRRGYTTPNRSYTGDPRPRPRTNTFTNPRSASFDNPRNTQGTSPRPQFGGSNPRSNTQSQEVSPRPRPSQTSEPRPTRSDYSSPRSNNGSYSSPRSNSGSYSSPRSSGGSFGGGNSGGGRSGGGRR